MNERKDESRQEDRQKAIRHSACQGNEGKAACPLCFSLSSDSPSLNQFHRCEKRNHEQGVWSVLIDYSSQNVMFIHTLGV